MLSSSRVRLPWAASCLEYIAVLISLGTSSLPACSWQGLHICILFLQRFYFMRTNWKWVYRGCRKIFACLLLIGIRHHLNQPFSMWMKIASHFYKLISFVFYLQIIWLSFLIWPNLNLYHGCWGLWHPWRSQIVWTTYSHLSSWCQSQYLQHWFSDICLRRWNTEICSFMFHLNSWQK